MWFWCHCRWRVATHWASWFLILLLLILLLLVVPVEGAASLDAKAASVIARHHSVRGVAGGDRTVAAWVGVNLNSGGSTVLGQPGAGVVLTQVAGGEVHLCICDWAERIINGGELMQSLLFPCQLLAQILAVAH